MRPADYILAAASSGVLAVLAGLLAFAGWGQGARRATIVASAVVCLLALAGAVALLVRGCS